MASPGPHLELLLVITRKEGDVMQLGIVLGPRPLPPLPGKLLVDATSGYFPGRSLVQTQVSLPA